VPFRHPLLVPCEVEPLRLSSVRVFRLLDDHFDVAGCMPPVPVLDTPVSCAA
jgi:hypothetical protein